jgi:ABC-type Fe3+ transport system substrate-binding protein
VRGFLVAALLALAAAPAPAQDFKAEWAKLVAAAETEGALTLHSQPNQAFRNFIQTEFAKAYPKIALTVDALPETQFWARIRTERQAEKYLWDMSVGGSSTGYTLSKEGIVDPLQPELIDPDVNRPELWGGWDEAFMDVEKKYVFSITAYVASPFYNAGAISPEKVAREGFKLLLEPEYKGKVYWVDPTVPGAGRNYIQLLKTQFGDEAFRRFVTDQVVIAAQHQVIENMARGVALVAVGPPVRGLMKPYEQAGVKLDLRTFGTGPNVAVLSAGGSGVYVYNRRPHPAATRVFVNWLLSRDVQYALAKVLDQRSRRQDVPETADAESIPQKGVKYFSPQREENIQLQEELMKLVADIRKTTVK